MKLYAALVFSFCMGLHGNSQTTNKAEVDHAGTQRIADASCDTAASSRPGLSQDQLAKAIIDQTICRGRRLCMKHGKPKIAFLANPSCSGIAVLYDALLVAGLLDVKSIGNDYSIRSEGSTGVIL
jgi:hypothetical protein